MKHIKLIFLFVVLVGAFVLGFMLNTPDAQSLVADATLTDTARADSTQTANVDYVQAETSKTSPQKDSVPVFSSRGKKPSSNTSQEDGVSSSSAKIKKILQDNSLTFAEVDNLAKSHPNDDLVQSYKLVVDAIRKNNIEGIKGNLLSKLTSFQENAIKILAYGETSGNYSDADKRIIKKVLSSQRFSSFLEMEAFKSNIRAKVNDEIKISSSAPSFANEEPDVSETLQKNDLMFKEIDELFRSRPQDITIRSYMNVITAIRKGVPETISHTDLKYLTYDQREAVKALYWGCGKNPYTAMQKSKVKEMLSKYHFSSFRDLIRFQREIELNDYLL